MRPTPWRVVSGGRLVVRVVDADGEEIIRLGARRNRSQSEQRAENMETAHLLAGSVALRRAAELALANLDATLRGGRPPVNEIALAKTLRSAIDASYRRGDRPSTLAQAVADVERDAPLPRCDHDNALLDGGGERLEPSCGCRAPSRPGRA